MVLENVDLGVDIDEAVRLRGGGGRARYLAVNPAAKAKVVVRRGIGRRREKERATPGRKRRSGNKACDCWSWSGRAKGRSGSAFGGEVGPAVVHGGGAMGRGGMFLAQVEVDEEERPWEAIGAWP